MQMDVFYKIQQKTLVETDLQLCSLLIGLEYFKK